MQQHHSKQRKCSVKEAESKEEKERTGKEELVTEGGAGREGVNERWHAGHLNAKAEGIDSESETPVCKT